MHEKAATVRRRRIAKHRFERRLKRGVLRVGTLYALAMLLSPKPGPVATVSHHAVPAFPGTALWRPAADVLNRKATEALKTARPWIVDTAQNVPRSALARWHRIYKFATRYAISADLARAVYDASIRANIEPELAFRLVNAESEFKTHALSTAGAVGLTQLMLGTAREFEPGVSRADLMNAETNLRIGFTYLRALIRENDGNLSLALLTYNRGPVAVQAALAQGLDPTNGYDRAITKGYKGRGTLD